MRIDRILVVAFFALLGGCGLISLDMVDPVARSAPSTLDPSTPWPDTEAPKTQSSARRTVESADQRRAKAVMPPAQIDSLAMDPEKLIGMTQAEATAILGRPVSVNDEPPATIWSYRSGGCVLDVFFYMDLGARMFRVLAYEMKANRRDAQTDRTCVGRIRAASATG
jgi:hypothetical protein